MPNTTSKLQTSLQVKVFILLLTIALIVLMFPKGESLEFEVSIGAIWIQEDLIASKTFEVLKEKEQYENEVLRAAESVYPVFINDEGIVDQAKDSLETYNVFLLNQLDQVIVSENEIKQNSTFLTQQSYNKFFSIRKKDNLFSSRQRSSMSDVFNISRRILDRVFQRGLISRNLDEIEKDTVGIRTGKYERLIPKRGYIDQAGLQSYVEAFIRSFTSDPDLYNAIEEYVLYFIKPNITFSPEETEAARELARNKVSRNIGIVNENERIVAKHDRITPEIKLKIDSYRIAKGEDTGYWERFSQGVGKFLHVIIVLSMLIIYVYLFRKKIFYDNFRIVLIVVIILFISFVTFIVRQINATLPIELLIFLPVASMLLTILFDSRIGFYGTVVIALIAGGLRGNDYVFVVSNVFAGALAAYTVRDIKNRSQIFRSFLYILIGYLVSNIAFGLERFDAIDEFLIRAGFSATNAIISPALTYGLIIFFEKSFRITTELTLLELTDFNHPLLKELARNAPGTFNHSMTIGSLVESAAEVIDANPLLARVGAYFHDVGKTINPHGFVENQLDNSNIHEELKPENSAAIIIEHVKKGTELAKEYNLPQEIIDFIPMHHGTMSVGYFLAKAEEIYGEGNFDPNEYRYPGPKPNSKETALVMLADACESAVRAMKDSAPHKIENLVNNLFKARIEDGQLDEAPITFGDLPKIKEAFLGILVGQHHKRIRYPKQDEIEKDSKDS